MLCAVPALRALRQACPQAHISLIGLASARPFAARFHHLVDELVELPGFPGLTPAFDAQACAEFFDRMQQRDFDLAVQMHGSGLVSNPAAELLGARRTAGFYVPGQYCPDPGAFIPYPSGHEILRNLRLVNSLGIPANDSRLEFPLDEQDHLELRNLTGGHGQLPYRYIAIHPGARVGARRWSPMSFAEVARTLASEGYSIVFTGSAGEAPLAEEIGRAAGIEYRNLAGPCSMGALAAILQGARLLISNDTGVSHVASALGVPSVIVFTAAGPARWAPLDPGIHRAVFAPVSCRPCDYGECPVHHPCSEQVTPRMVLQAAGSLLGREERRHVA